MDVDGVDLPALRKQLAGHVDVGEVSGSLAELLADELRLAAYHEGRGATARAAPHLERFLARLQHPAFQRHVADRARELLVSGGSAVLGNWRDDDR